MLQNQNFPQWVKTQEDEGLYGELVCHATSAELAQIASSKEACKRFLACRKGWINRIFSGLRSLFQPKLEVEATDDKVAKALKNGLRGIKDEIAEAVVQKQKAEEFILIDFSTCGIADYAKFFYDRNIIITTHHDKSEVKTNFESFEWRRNEEDDTPRARDHLRTQLKRHGAKFKEGHFEIYDCHAIKGVLSVEDEKLGNLRGGTDLIIAPHGLEIISCTQRASVIFEVKKSITDQHCSQAILKLIAANYWSHFPVITVLTDLKTVAHVYRLAESNKIEHIIMSTSQMARTVCEHMKIGNYYDIDYKLDQTIDVGRGRKRPNQESTHIEFSKRFRSPPDEIYEQFQELLEMTEPGTSERQEVVKQYFGAICSNHETNDS